MDKKQKLDKVYMNIAKEVSTLSYCKRAQVGAIIVNDGNIISFGYNGTPSGMDNCCEENDTTKFEVIHAEMNAILKADRSVKGATMYLTLSPCKECCKLLLQAGIAEVVYDTEYRDTTGIDFLKQQTNITIRRL